MTIHVLGLNGEALRLSDRQHSTIITQENNTFTLADGESEFSVEQIRSAPSQPKTGWGMYLAGQILTALPRALVIRKPVYERCNPVLLSAKVSITPCRYDFLTLFYVTGGYNSDTHTFCPPRLEGDPQLAIEASSYAVDEANVVRAAREEVMSKIGYAVNLLLVPIVLFIVGILWQTPPLMAIALAILIIDGLISVGLFIHSKKARSDLQKKVADSVYYLNLAKE